jgi:hypothetical protein
MGLPQTAVTSLTGRDRPPNLTATRTVVAAPISGSEIGLPTQSCPPHVQAVSPSELRIVMPRWSVRERTCYSPRAPKATPRRRSDCRQATPAPLSIDALTPWWVRQLGQVAEGLRARGHTRTRNPPLRLSTCRDGGRSGLAGHQSCPTPLADGRSGQIPHIRQALGVVSLPWE